MLSSELVQPGRALLLPGHGEEGRQVGRVGGDDDEPEQPPGGRHQPAGQILGDSQVSQNNLGLGSVPTNDTLDIVLLIQV